VVNPGDFATPSDSLASKPAGSVAAGVDPAKPSRPTVSIFWQIPPVAAFERRFARPKKKTCIDNEYLN